MTRGRSGAVCAVLALAAHAALLVEMPPSPVSVGRPAAQALSTRAITEAAPVAPSGEVPPADPSAAPPQPAADATAQPAEAAASTGPESARPDAQAPAFASGSAPELGFPDAALPPEGVRLRAYVALDADGSPSEVTAAIPPGEAVVPAGFQKAAERALRQARFEPGRGLAYCFLVTFTPDAPAPQLGWLPGAARDAGRCLTGAQPPVQPMPGAAGH